MSIYKDNEYNRRLNRVGQHYGNTDEATMRLKQYLSEQTDEQLEALIKTSDNSLNIKLGWQALTELKQRKYEREKRYTKIKATAVAVMEGQKRICCLVANEETGRCAGGRRNVEASIVLGTNARKLQSLSRIDDIKRAQEQELEHWARHEGCLFKEAEVAEWERLDNGTSQEAKVYKFPTTNTVRKVFTYDALDSNYTPMDFLNDRISLHNALFPETKYTLLGFMKTRYGLRFVVEQPFIDGIEVPLDEVKNYMASLGFLNNIGNYYWNDYHVVGDLHSRNIMKVGGKYYVIDPVPRLNTPDEEGGKAKYLRFKVVNNYPIRIK